MKNAICLSLLLVGFGLSVSAFAETLATPLTRAVQVIEEGVQKQYLGTAFGQTLYTFDLDSNGHSVCNGACAEKWPALLISDVEAKALKAPYGVITRASGLFQVTYLGKPLYTFFLDHVEGDDKGDGIGGIWHDIDFVAVP